MIGSVLVQPQRVRRAQTADPATLLGSDLASLITRLIMDAEQGGHVMEIMRDTAQQALIDMLEARRDAAEAAIPGLADWLLRAMRALTGIGPDLQVGSPADGLELAHTLVEHLAAASADTSAARIEPYIADLLGILENDLGLSFATLETELWNVVDRIIDALEDQPVEIDATARTNRLDTIRMLRRFRRLVRGQFPLPRLEAARIASAIAGLLHRLDVATLGEKLRCVSNNLGTVSETTRAIEDVVPIGFSNFGSVGAAASSPSELYCWYASWLLGGPVVINGARTQIKLGDEVIHEGTNLTPADLPQFQASSDQHYTFGRVDVATMETMTYVAYVTTDALNLLCHLASLEKGDYASNSLNAGWWTFTGIYKLAAGRPSMSNGLEGYLLPLLVTLLPTLEGMHTNVNVGNWFAMWITLALPDLGETVIYRVGTETARDGLLSFFTLLNYDGDFHSGADPDPRPLNRLHFQGVAALPGLLISMGQFAVYPREEYAQPFQNGDHAVKMLLFHNLFVGSLFTILNRVSGYLLAMAVGRSFDPKEWALDLFGIPDPPWSRIPFGWLTWFVQLYMAKEGDTADGTYNPGGAAFNGYPAHDSSPYTLPYPEGTTEYAGQGNQGVFSHNFMNIQQTYSYDFCMDGEKIILASRPGTVVDYFDWVADDINPDTAEQTAAMNEAAASGFLVAGQSTSDAWNYIAIRHDVDDAGNALAPDAVHDLGPGGTSVTTYALYGHGRKNSVREMFGDRGIAETSIIGTTVKRGDPIMRAGDTGISFCNHLHMMVKAGSATDPPPVQRGSLATPTIPFVFKEVTHMFGRDGVCRALNFYTSSTAQTP